MPICSQDEFFVEPKEIKQAVALEEVSTTAKIFEEVDKLKKECKGVGINKLEVLPSMEDNIIMVRLFFMISKSFSAEEECQG